MIKHDPVLPPEFVYPIDDWRLVERTYTAEFLAQNETLMATANGYLGMRGGFFEGEPAFLHGTYLNGFYETWPIPYGEKAFGFAKTGQTMVNVPDGKIIRLYVDDEPFTFDRADLEGYERALDMKCGTYERETTWETPSGKKVHIRVTRFVSFAERHVAAVRCEVTLLNGAAPVVVASEMLNHAEIEAHAMRDSIAAGVSAPSAADDPRLAKSFKDEVLVLEECAEQLHDGVVHLGDGVPLPVEPEVEPELQPRVPRDGSGRGQHEPQGEQPRGPTDIGERALPAALGQGHPGPDRGGDQQLRPGTGGHGPDGTDTPGEQPEQGQDEGEHHGVRVFPGERPHEQPGGPGQRRYPDPLDRGPPAPWPVVDPGEHGPERGDDPDGGLVEEHGRQQQRPTRQGPSHHRVPRHGPPLRTQSMSEPGRHGEREAGQGCGSCQDEGGGVPSGDGGRAGVRCLHGTGLGWRGRGICVTGM
jgi:hypothetical protein